LKITPGLAALMCVPPLLWAGNAVVGRLAAGHIPPQLLTALRWTIALALLLPLGWRVVGTREARALLGARWRYLAGLGLAGVALYNALQYAALTTTTAVNATLIASSGPVWMMLLGAWLYGEHPQRRQWLGSVLSLAGVAVVIGRGDVGAPNLGRLVLGDLLMLVATVVWALYSWLLARPPASMRAPQRPAWRWHEFLVVQMLFGVGWTWAFAAAEQLVAPQPLRLDSAWVPGALLYVALGPSIVAFWLWGVGVVRAGPTAAAFFANLTPVFAALLSALLVGEAPQPYHALAFALVIAGIVVSSRH
jgi:drug/metabolite transporter (DMT)-like permease